MISRTSTLQIALYAFAIGLASGLLLFISLGAEWKFAAVVFWFLAALSVLVGFVSVVMSVNSLLSSHRERK
jgi:hypothetical protein